jgi:predicted ArsR family transcriptional regulator
MAKSGESGDVVIQRRVAVLRALPATREDLGELLDCNPRTIRRDLDWLRENGVPLESRQVSQSSPAVWSVARSFRAKDWFWRWGCGTEGSLSEQ